MSQYIVDVTEATFTAEIEQAELPVLVDFWAPWCGPCRMLAPRFEELAQMYQGRVKFAKVNIDDNNDLSKRLEVKGIPALLLFKEGEVVTRTTGAKGRTSLAEMLDEHSVAPVASRASSWHAFHGDGELKQRVIDQARAPLQVDQALHGTDMAAYEAAFGIPASAALLEDFVHGNLTRRSMDAQGKLSRPPHGTMRDYHIEWLEHIPPSADLQHLASHFLNWLLLEVIDAPPALPFDTTCVDSIKSAVRDVASLHKRLTCGDAPTAAEWAAAREAIVKAAPNPAEERYSWVVANLAEELSSPPGEHGYVALDGLDTFYRWLSSVLGGELNTSLTRLQMQQEGQPSQKDAEPMDKAQIEQRYEARMEQLRSALDKYLHHGLMLTLATTTSKGAR